MEDLNISQKVEDHFSLNRPIQKVRVSRKNENGKSNNQYLYVIDGLNSQFHVTHYSMLTKDYNKLHNRTHRSTRRGLKSTATLKNVKSYVSRLRPEENVAGTSDPFKTANEIQLEEFKSAKLALAIKEKPSRRVAGDSSAIDVTSNPSIYELNKNTEEKNSFFGSDIGESKIEGSFDYLKENENNLIADDNDEYEDEDDDDDDDDYDDGYYEDDSDKEIPTESEDDENSYDFFGHNSDHLPDNMATDRDDGDIPLKKKVREESKYTLVTQVTKVQTYGLPMLVLRFIILYPTLITLAIIYIGIVNSFIQYLFGFLAPRLGRPDMGVGDYILLLSTLLCWPMIFYNFCWALSLGSGFVVDNWHEFEFLGAFKFCSFHLRQWLIIGLLFICPMAVLFLVCNIVDLATSVRYAFVSTIFASLFLLLLYVALSLGLQIHLWATEMGTFVPWKLLKRALSVRFEGWMDNPSSTWAKMINCNSAGKPQTHCSNRWCCSCCACDRTSERDLTMMERRNGFEGIKFGLSRRIYQFFCLSGYRGTFLHGVGRCQIWNIVFMTLIIMLVIYGIIVIAIDYSQTDYKVTYFIATIMSLFFICFLTIRAYRAFFALRRFRAKTSLDFDREITVSQNNNRNMAVSRRSPSIFLILLASFICLGIFLVTPLVGFLHFGAHAWAFSYLLYFLFGSIRWIFSPKALLERPGSQGFEKLKSKRSSQRRLYLLINRIDQADLYGVFVVLMCTFLITILAIIFITEPATNTLPITLLQTPSTSDRGEFSKYPICNMPNEPLKSADISIVDLAFISKVAFVGQEEIQNQLDLYFGANEMTLLDVNLTTDTQAFFYVVMYPAKDLIFITVRGPVYSTRILETFSLWFESTLLQLVMELFPYSSLWSFAYPYIIKAMAFGYQFRATQSVYEDIVLFIDSLESALALRNITGYTVVLTGHGLGGGLSIIAGALTNTQTIVFSAPNANYPHLKFGVSEESINKNVINIEPENDAVAVIGGSALLKQSIYCNSFESSACHSLQRTMCALQYNCGSNGRPIFSDCPTVDSILV